MWFHMHARVGETLGSNSNLVLQSLRDSREMLWPPHPTSSFLCGSQSDPATSYISANTFPWRKWRWGRSLASLLIFKSHTLGENVFRSCNTVGQTFKQKLKAHARSQNYSGWVKPTRAHTPMNSTELGKNKAEKAKLNPFEGVYFGVAEI